MLRPKERISGSPATAWKASAEVELGRLYRDHRLSLVRLAVLLLGDQEAAEDVVQDVFARLYGGRAPEEISLAYVRTCVLNGSRSLLRRRKMVSRSMERDGGARAESAEVSTLLGEERREMLTALGRLPRRQRETLVLRYYLDLSDAEISQVMRIREGTVRSTVARALARLQKELEGNA
ncbi:RNA polymerase sigma factor [Nonomuraea jiangxiensis]|uniref:RNA polymerase sigma factor n=1 Tax=Nonomuraea jiangxiensis TaxID=633440 RepID=UPI001FECEEF1|nr:sigma-70 family RNA polymerase sigma factor [Nonomuraea jiangxiensis]